jgi:hypothetical protein
LQDLVLSLMGSNLKDMRIRGLWLKKRDIVNDGLKLLSVSDFKWLSLEYKEWHRKNVLPRLTGDLAIYASEISFPWI